MTTPHKATPEQWAELERYLEVINNPVVASAMLELRDRIAALEAQRETEKACILEIYEKLDRLKTQHESNWARIVKLEEAANHFPDATKMVPAPAGGLVERVAGAIHPSVCADPNETGTASLYLHDARAAILAVAEWLEKQNVGAGRAAARWLREEVQRHV